MGGNSSIARLRDVVSAVVVVLLPPSAAPPSIPSPSGLVVVEEPSTGGTATGAWEERCAGPSPGIENTPEGSEPGPGGAGFWEKALAPRVVVVVVVVGGT